MRTPLLLAALLAAPVVLPACGGTQSGGDQTAEQIRRDTAKLETRLQGVWRLADYRPEVPLEPTFQMLLIAQMQTMQIRFENGQLLADSPSIHLKRTYRLSDIAGDIFKFTAIDDAGVQVVSSCQISEDNVRITFRGETSPWKGWGTLVRMQ